MNFFAAFVYSLSHVQLFATPWTAACRAFQSFIISQSLLTLMSIKSVMPSNHLILCHPLLLLLSIFPASESFPVSQLFIIWWLKYSTSASASVIQLNIQDLFPFGLTGLISMLSRGLSRVFSSTPFGDISCLVLNLFYCPALTSIHDCWKNHSFDYTDVCQQVMSLLFNTLSRFVIVFLPRSKHLLISWLQSPPSDFGAQENKVCHCFHGFPIYLPWSDGTRCHDLCFLNVEI